jgi:adenylate cyclase
MDTYKPLLCIVDDDTEHSHAMSEYLTALDFRVVTFPSAKEFLAQTNIPEPYDLVVSDINMPGGASGFDLCRTLRARAEAVRLPIILITGSDPSIDKVQGLEAGADEFIAKPFSARHLIAKIRSLLAIRAEEMRRHQELVSSKGLNIELGRFVSPNIASRMSVDDRQGFLLPHRAEVTVLFVDLRRFTAFSEKAEPEEVLEVLQQYYTAVGTAAMKYNGTLGHLAGDGIMIFFNDPEPVEDHKEMAVRMALEAREALLIQKKFWDQRHYDIDFGIGLSEGYATIGGIGFDRFSQYSVIGTVANFASRLCHVAIDGQILISQRFFSRLKAGTCEAAAVGEVTLKGIERPVSIYNILAETTASLKSAA